VANHQLRVMKKELQDRAVSNEREYFEERVAKRKFDLALVIDWIKPALQADPSTHHFTAFSKGTFLIARVLIISLRKFIITLNISSNSVYLPLRYPSVDQLPKGLSRFNSCPVMSPSL
jgi:T-complex protein 11